MAGKRAEVYIIDLGASTGECHNGRTESDLDYGMRYVWDKIATAMISGQKGWNIGIIGLRTDETDNPLAENPDSGYENLTWMKPLGQMEMSHLRELQKNIKPSNTDDGDAISAIVLAVNRIESFTTLKTGKPGAFARKIVLVTDGQGSIDGEDIENIAKQINKFDMELVVIGIDFDDKDYGFLEKDKSKLKKDSEMLLRELTTHCSHAVFGTAKEAIDEISAPQTKVSKPYKTFEGRLQLGDFQKYEETALHIDIQRYFKTKSAKPVSASSFVSRDSASRAEDSAQSSNTLNGDTEMLGDGGVFSAVRNARTYKVNDSSAPGGKKDVDLEELAKGYEYGRTAVHITESDENVTKIETIQSFSIIGFIPSDKYEQYLNMGESCVTVAASSNDKARMAFSSLVHALHELDSYAVARLVAKNMKDPQILLLAPSIEPDIESLIDVPLPFAEDVRMYRFPPLDRVITTSGAVLTKHRNLPNNDLVASMSDYVDKMDLSAFGEDDDGQPTEYIQFDETFSPAIHRINQAIRQRAMRPDDPVGEAASTLTKWAFPPEELVSNSATELEKLITVADVKKVPPKAKGKRGRFEPTKPLSGLDVDELLAREKRQKISANNAIPEFKQMLAQSEADDAIPDAMRQMSKITHSLIATSVGDEKYDQALCNIREMRHHMIEMEEPDLYNEFLRDLKSFISKEGGFGSRRRELWLQIKLKKLGLIDNQTSEFSDVSEKEATEFHSLSTALPSRSRD